MKTVYTCFCTDVIHEGHLNIIREGMKHGKVIAGVLGDEAMIRFNRFPAMEFEERMELIRGIEGVSEVVVQHIGIDYLKANGMEHILEEKGVVPD